MQGTTAVQSTEAPLLLIWARLLQVITVVMPEHLAALRSLKKKEELVSALELLDSPDITATSIEVCFPTVRVLLMPLAKMLARQITCS